ncbi:MAG: hypothetical protein M1820_001245 [Bogoriella megaspora]|nr:MAG: hypothetical protein M1820_001245 [Bogoriella megaspora]
MAMLGVASHGERDHWRRWLATANFEDAPGEIPGSEHGFGGTPAPLAKYDNPYVGYPLEALAELVRSAPESKQIEPEYFAVLDE